MDAGSRKHFATHGGVVAAFALVALLGAGAASAGIANTKHNLGSATNPLGRNQVTETDEICVFCHTPHGGETTNPAPLWNKRLNTGGAAFTTYQSIGSSTMNARFADDGLTGSVSVGSVSLACLSCHDGTQAMDNIINAPGSGGLTADGGSTNGLGWTWSGPNVTALGMLTGVAALGKDLSNDHPIGIQYCGGGPMESTPSGSCRDLDFTAPTTAVIASVNQWWVDSGSTAGSRDKGDMILYRRNFPTDGVGPSVECATCHDPHSEDTATRKTFLRIANTGSAVCLSCHVK